MNCAILNSHRRGIALLITLVILALLAVFMTEFSFETTLETRGIQNFQASFRARNAVKSVFKAVLVGLETQDEVIFFREYLRNLLELGALSREISFLNPPQPIRLFAGVIADFPDVVFYTPYIRPLDHLFNLNRLRKNNPGTPEDLKLHHQFVNILKNMTTVKGQVPLDDNAFDRIYAALFDWTDRDREPYQMIGVEHYQDLLTEIEVKNQKLDLLREILLIEGIAESGIPFDNLYPEQGSWKKYFTIYPVENRAENFEQARINVNLATGNEIIEFLMQFENPSDFSSSAQKFVAQAPEIGAALSLKNGEKEKTYRSAAEIQKTLDTNPTTSGLPVIAKQFLIAYGSWYEIRLKTEIDNVQAEVRAIVSVARDGNGKVTKLTIHDFLLH